MRRLRFLPKTARVRLLSGILLFLLLQTVCPAGPFCLTASAAEGRIIFDPNGAQGEMEDLLFTEGEDVTLPVCSFHRDGYIFRGWATNMDQAAFEYQDRSRIEDAVSMVLFALWEPQMYIVQYDAGGAPAGAMADAFEIYDQSFALPRSGFGRLGFRFGGWLDEQGRIRQPGELVKNLHSGNTFSRRILTVDAGDSGNGHRFRSTQGSVVFEKDGGMYVLTAASINDESYYAGDLSHYQTVLTLCSLRDGTTVSRVLGLPFDHGNGICRREDNGHFYIAEGGTLEDYPSGIMELDENLNFVREYTLPLLSHVWAIAWDGEHFYVIGRSGSSRNSFCTLNENLETLSITEVDEYYAQSYSSQGIAADENFLYCLSASFKAYEWKSKQRINVFTHDGRYVGVWTIDIPYEAEDITIIGDYAYISTNEGAKAGIYRTRLPLVVLRAVWLR